MGGASKGDEEVQVPVVDQHLQLNDDKHGDHDDHGDNHDDHGNNHDDHDDDVKCPWQTNTCKYCEHHHGDSYYHDSHDDNQYGDDENHNDDHDHDDHDGTVMMNIMVIMMMIT